MAKLPPIRPAGTFSPWSRGEGKKRSTVATSGSVFEWPVRVYWEDTDAGGVVFHGSYVRFFERARSEYLRALGIEQSTLLQARGIVFAIAGMELGFVAPAYLDDALIATCELVRRGAVSLRFEQELRRVEDRMLIARASVRAACLDAADFRPRAMPEGLFGPASS